MRYTITFKCNGYNNIYQGNYLNYLNGRSIFLQVCIYIYVKS